MKNKLDIFIVWVVAMFLITFSCSLIYIVAQQSLRLGANLAPEQLVVEMAAKLDKTQNVQSVLPASQVDISKSLNAFVMIFDDNKELKGTNAVIGTDIPGYPTGVLAHVSSGKEDRVTWQPQQGFRFASVAMKYDHGYIVAAISLRETEALIGTIGSLVLLAWLAFSLFSVFVATAAYFVLRRSGVF